jgi:spermidine synthase
MDPRPRMRAPERRAEPEPRVDARSTRLSAILLTTLTGFTGLAYEVTWQKYLATLLGSHAEATAGVLAIFLGGLSAGYAIFGQLTRRRAAGAMASGGSASLLALYAFVECGIGVYALLFPSLFGIASRLSVLVPAANAGLAFGIDLSLCVLLIGLPAVLMGGTIPILTLALARDREHSTRVHAWIYGANTAGACAGALASAFLLIPRLGLDGVLYAMGAVNLLAGGAFALLGAFGAGVEPAFQDDERAEAPGRGFAAYATVALLAGFAMMALQTILNRVAALSLGSSHFTFAIVVAVFVLCIAAGSLVVSAFRTIPRWTLVATQWLLVILLYLLYGEIEDATYWAYALAGIFSRLDVAFYPFHAATAAALFCVFAIPIGLSGALLPLLFHHLRGEVSDLGAVAGRLYSWNTVGSLLGALLGGQLLLLFLDLDGVYRVALAALVLQAAILTVLVLRMSAPLVALLVVLPAWAGLWTLPGWAPERLAVGLFRQHERSEKDFIGPSAYFEEAAQAAKVAKKEMVFHEDDPVSTITVNESPPVDGRLNRSIVTNGKSDGNLIKDYTTMSMLALVPALFADEHESCFVIGYGTGVTAGELAALSSVRRVEVAEISRAVIEAAPWFEEGNLGASKSPKVAIERGDAYRTLLRREIESIDIVVSEPSNPWVTGVEMLYSREFLEAARERLSPGGVYAQWFHLYEIDREAEELVLRTFASVFPHVSVWYTLGSDILLLGFNRTDRALDLEEVVSRFARPDFKAGFQRAGIQNVASLLSHELLPIGVLHSAGLEGPLHTLRHPLLSHLAARAFFRGDSVGVLPKYPTPEAARIGSRNSLLRRRAATSGGESSERVIEAAARETCKRQMGFECATLLAVWRKASSRPERVETYLSSLRREWNVDVIGDGNLGVIDVLLRGEVRSVPERRSLARAKMISSRYSSHYHHAFPFDRRALRSAWDACRGEACASARRGIERELGSLDPAEGETR